MLKLSGKGQSKLKLSGNGNECKPLFVGSVNFYCTAGDQRQNGAALLAKAAVNGSPEAHHTLAIMHFNGSGGRRKDKDPEGGAALCARGNILFGSVPAKRELGHCLQAGAYTRSR
jgi:hypothetical protein